MPRPKTCRRVGEPPECCRFRPVQGGGRRGSTVSLGLDELEAVRLADLHGLYHEDAAARMGISRATFGRVLVEARCKIALALVEGLPVHIEGGRIDMERNRRFRCADCQHVWAVPHGTPRPEACPSCSSANLHRHEDERGPEGGGGGRRRRQGCSCWAGQGPGVPRDTLDT